MIITTYICDKCEKPVPYTDLYSMEITRGVKSAGGTGSVGGIYSTMCCAPIVYNTKHICTSCLKEMFPDIFDRA